MHRRAMILPGRMSTRGRLLDAAYRIILEDSLSNLSIERVSARAGLSRRTFFLHVNSKDQLLAEVLEHVRPAFAEFGDRPGHPVHVVVAEVHHDFECLGRLRCPGAAGTATRRSLQWPSDHAYGSSHEQLHCHPSAVQKWDGRSP